MLKTVSAIVLAVSAVGATAWADCTGPAGKAGAMIFNDDHNIMQFCDGTDWRAMGGSTTVTSAKQCGLVSTTHTGNLGGTAGADAICAAYFESGWTFGTAAKVLTYRPGVPYGNGYAWVSDATTNCTNWSSTSGNGKAVWSLSGSWSNSTYDAGCSSSYPIACCNY